MNILEFNNRNYPVVDILMPFGQRRISIVELNDALMTKEGDYCSKEARIIDEQLFYYVKKEIITLSEDHIVNKILLEL